VREVLLGRILSLPSPALPNAKLVNSVGRGIKGEGRFAIVCRNLCKDP